MEDNNAIGLLEFNLLLKEIIEGNFMGDIWLIAEIADLKVNSASGHCYMELIEKKNNQVVAKIRANIWSFNYQRIAQRFFKNTGTTLQNGIKILFTASVNFHEIYGPSLVIKNIDENYTLGDHEKNKTEIFNRLQKEGLLQKNKIINWPVFIKKIAVISSENAAGYEDFCHQLHYNAKQFVFHTTLFPSLMQGEHIYKNIIDQINEIIIRKEDFDCIAIIRGGGASMDLNGFNNYELCKTIAMCPLPVVSGIGHDRDHTLLDEVVHTKLKTPTAVAEFFVSKAQDMLEYIEGLKDAIEQISKEKISRNKLRINKLGIGLFEKSSGFSKQQNQKINTVKENLSVLVFKKIKQHETFLREVPARVKSYLMQLNQKQYIVLNQFHQQLEYTNKSNFQKQKNKIAQYQQTVKYLNPQNVLNRGYTMVKNQQNFIKSVSDFNPNEEFVVIFKDGEKTIKYNLDGKK